MRTFAVVLFAILLTSQFIVSANATTIEEVTRGLETQYQANLIRERRLADDREQRLLQDAEARVQRARAQADARAAGAESELVLARAAYAQLASSLIARDDEARELSEAYSIQVARDLVQASAPQLEALQRFADGDLRAGFEQYRAESQRRSAARRRVAVQVAAAADASDISEARQQAIMADSMVSWGRAPVTEALDLWDALAVLSPRDSYAHQRRAALALQINNLTLAQVAAEAARENAVTDQERLGALGSLQRIASLRNDTAEAARISQSALQLARQVHARSPASLRLAYYLSSAAGPQLERGDSASAGRLYEEAIAAGLSRLQEAPNDLNNDFDIVAATVGLAQIRARSGDPIGALRRLGEASANLDRLMSPNRAAHHYSLVVSTLTFAGGLAQQTGNFAAARDALQNAADMARAAMQVDPSNTDFARAYSAALTALADVNRQLGDTSRARELYRESLEIDQRLYEADPSNVIRVTDYWVSLWRVARYGGGRWSQVVQVMEGAQRQGLLPAQYRQSLDDARRLAREQRR